MFPFIRLLASIGISFQSFIPIQGPSDDHASVLRGWQPFRTHPYPGNFMQESISIILPVRDRQSTIEARTELLLELLSELNADLQLIFVDDHSTDATPEILDDMRRKYPQVEVTRNPWALGPSQAAESALGHARGDFIFLHQTYDAVDFDELMRLWQLRRDEQLVIARATTRVRRIDNGLLQRLQGWGRKLEEQWPGPRGIWNGLQMMKRSGLQSLHHVQDAAEEIEVTHQSHRSLSQPRIATDRDATVQGVTARQTPAETPRRPNNS